MKHDLEVSYLDVKSLNPALNFWMKIGLTSRWYTSRSRVYLPRNSRMRDWNQETHGVGRYLYPMSLAHWTQWVRFDPETLRSIHRVKTDEREQTSLWDSRWWESQAVRTGCTPSPLLATKEPNELASWSWGHMLNNSRGVYESHVPSRQGTPLRTEAMQRPKSERRTRSTWQHAQRVRRRMGSDCLEWRQTRAFIGHRQAGCCARDVRKVESSSANAAKMDRWPPTTKSRNSWIFFQSCCCVVGNKL